MVTPLYAWNQENLPDPIYRYRTNWIGKLILQVAEARRLYCIDVVRHGNRYEWSWRDATAKDITKGKVV